MKIFKHQIRLMGSAFELGLVHETESEAQHFLDVGIQEIKRIEELLSEFKPTSQTSLINEKAALTPFKTDRETFDLLDRCLAISKLTKGHFDITVGPLKKLYSFKNKEFTFPSSHEIETARSAVGYQNISVNREQCTVHFTHPQTKISFAAIGKGYASDQVIKRWKNQGITSGYVNASGDLAAFGHRPDGKPWRIGIAHPDDPKNMLFFVPLLSASVATSGDYEQYFMHQNKRYSHNIHPFTGLPLTGLKSVSVFSPGAELSDALATALYAMGPQDGIAFCNQLPQTHCLMIDDQNKVIFTKNLQYEMS